MSFPIVLPVSVKAVKKAYQSVKNDPEVKSYYAGSPFLRHMICDRRKSDLVFMPMSRLDVLCRKLKADMNDLIHVPEYDEDILCPRSQCEFPNTFWCCICGAFIWKKQVVREMRFTGIGGEGGEWWYYCVPCWEWVANSRRITSHICFDDYREAEAGM